MSTAWMCQRTLENIATKNGFDFVQVQLSPRDEMTSVYLAEIPPKEYRLIKNGVNAFQGDAYRCSDFLMGYVCGRASVR